MLVVVFWLQAVLAVAGTLTGLWLAVADGGRLDSLAVGLAVVALGIAALLWAFGRAIRRGKTWFRGPAITLELISIAAVISSWNDLDPLIAIAILATALAAGVLMFVPAVLTATTNPARGRGAYPSDE
ncbi:hypothetical protein FB461_0340 [Rarobacter faecitabidus]|uniref:Uncharacterized protein n=2 Tax=Rarobacter faecitabidus TaxID=13243 RepID=A0A542ZU28_RARFA|nr:hypothetical protein FB461_0340 [Rarobacter faecitabidus]